MATGTVVEAVADVIEETGENLEEVAGITRGLDRRALGFFFGGLGVGTAVGFGIGYFVANKRLMPKYAQIAEEEISEMREHYRKLNSEAEQVIRGSKPALDDVMDHLGYKQKGDQAREFSEKEQEAIAETNARFPAEAEAVEVVEEEVVHKNVFTEPEEFVWDYAVEVKKRTKEVPYVIHIDEFQQNEPENEQVTYTYYEGDDVLVDHRDQPIEDMDRVIGLGNLLRFGHGSDDENVVYVRNEELLLDIEITRSTGEFTKEVLGFIQHSDERRRRPHRGFDDD